MIGELTEERYLQLKIEEFKIEKEHYRLLKENYRDLQLENPTNDAYEVLFRQVQDNYDLVSEKLSVYNSLLRKI
jgi:hypothetical protein|nr:MAG TPA: hypothetical protein [Bacteriophage sp.]